MPKRGIAHLYGPRFSGQVEQAGRGWGAGFGQRFKDDSLAGNHIGVLDPTLSFGTVFTVGHSCRPARARPHRLRLRARLRPPRNRSLTPHSCVRGPPLIPKATRMNLSQYYLHVRRALLRAF